MPGRSACPSAQGTAYSDPSRARRRVGHSSITEGLEKTKFEAIKYTLTMFLFHVLTIELTGDISAHVVCVCRRHDEEPHDHVDADVGREDLKAAQEEDH